MMGKRTVPFRTRLQMYPRREHLVLILWVPFSFVLLVMDASVTSAVFLGLACALAMWVAIPDFNRYRMFGVPVSSWIMDTAIAVHVVALVYIAVWTSAGFGPLSFLGIVLADAGVLLWALFTHSPLTRGDQRVRARAANGWAVARGAWANPLAACVCTCSWRRNHVGPDRRTGDLADHDVVRRC